VVLVQNALFYANPKPIADLSLKHRLPVLSGESGFAAAGGLANHGPNVADLWRRSANLVDKILKGAMPGDLPIEQPTKFEVVVNLKTAKALGVTIPPVVLIQADEVIE
jgi:putative tryptophan/tyrosine transport system substrate-binding protein